MVTDPRKINAVKDFPVPANLKQLKSFSGLASYCRRFIKNYSKVANPLFVLTKKNVVYVELKELLTTWLILISPKDSYLLLMLDWVQSYLKCKRTTLYNQLHTHKSTLQTNKLLTGQE